VAVEVAVEVAVVAAVEAAAGVGLPPVVVEVAVGLLEPAVEAAGAFLLSVLA
jgi:hypothetical protein